MPFTSDLIVKPLRGSSRRMLEAALVYAADDGVEFCVGRGFITDYATVPPLLRPWVDQDSGMIREAAVLHDYLYTHNGIHKYTRRQVDMYFYEAMRALGMPLIKAYLVWLAVRLMGEKYWN